MIVKYPRIGAITLKTTQYEYDGSMESGLEETLPYEIQSHLFTFFTKKDLRVLALVNKNFNGLSYHEIERLRAKYKDSIFYTVGQAIKISSPERFFLGVDATFSKRKMITKKELYDSFRVKNNHQIRLFNIQEEAFYYANALRSGDQLFDKDVSQPAVFKVIYLGKPNKINIQHTDIILDYGFCGPEMRWDERSMEVTFFEVDRDEVIPLTGKLKIGKFLTYAPIDYANLNFVEESSEKTAFSIQAKCAVS